jgi:hypothetical protein
LLLLLLCLCAWVWVVVECALRLLEYRTVDDVCCAQ